jgi:hypothetical protein
MLRWFRSCPLSKHLLDFGYTYSFAWLNARTGTLTMPVDSLDLARVTRHSYSVVNMQGGAVANDLAFVEYDLAVIDIDHGTQLVVKKLAPVMFDVFREPDAVPDRECNLLPLGTPSDRGNYR